ncbi:hypothetical protein [Vibrio palustris]|uniref:Uncharacterized protein n=1 Tax=Vibrio palustris TaxID=1918946 RepID=A0A1R4B250_9VIBR|nr:hypothetical protein [Vibrio palustris]SJL82997.1 hypothetical protein VPAL9027_00943 [Vibrio palustris]
MKMMTIKALLLTAALLSPEVFAYMNPSAHNMMGGAMMDPKNPQYQRHDSENKKSNDSKSTSASRSKIMSASERAQLRRKQQRAVVNQKESQAAKQNREMLYGEDGMPLRH